MDRTPGDKDQSTPSLVTVSALIEGARRRHVDDEWRAVEEVVADVIEPAIRVRGLADAVAELSQNKEDPYIASVLVQLSSDTPTFADKPFRITDVYSDDEIVGAAASYLEAPGRDLESGQWAWTALWNGWGQLAEDDHLRIVLKLIDRVPADDRILWMIGDGPLAHAASTPEREAQIEERARRQPKIERIWQLIDADAPGT